MRGVYTAIITPFTDDGKIDFTVLERLIAFQQERGVAGIVVGGTTGEATTLSFDEKRELYRFVRGQARNLDLIAGTGTNNTAESVKLTEMAVDLGYRHVLAVTPYYNKPTCKGLIKHYREIARTGVRIVLYHVPGRTGLTLPPTWLKELAEIPEIVAIKEASGNMVLFADYLEAVGPGRFAMLSGDDFTIVPFLALGGRGVISVLSNILPGETVSLVESALAGDFSKAADLQIKLNSLIRTLFIESNPIPVKTALSLMGYCREVFRLPLAPMEEKTRTVLIETLKRYGLL